MEAKHKACSPMEAELKKKKKKKSMTGMNKWEENDAYVFCV